MKSKQINAMKKNPIDFSNKINLTQKCLRSGLERQYIDLLDTSPYLFLHCSIIFFSGRLKCRRYFPRILFG